MTPNVRVQKVVLGSPSKDFPPKTRNVGVMIFLSSFMDRKSAAEWNITSSVHSSTELKSYDELKLHKDRLF